MVKNWPVNSWGWGKLLRFWQNASSKSGRWVMFSANYWEGIKIFWQSPGGTGQHIHITAGRFSPQIFVPPPSRRPSETKHFHTAKQIYSTPRDTLRPVPKFPRRRGKLNHGTAKIKITKLLATKQIYSSIEIFVLTSQISRMLGGRGGGYPKDFNDT